MSRAIFEMSCLKMARSDEMEIQAEQAFEFLVQHLGITVTVHLILKGPQAGSKLLGAQH